MPNTCVQNVRKLFKDRCTSRGQKSEVIHLAKKIARGVWQTTKLISNLCARYSPDLSTTLFGKLPLSEYTFYPLSPAPTITTTKLLKRKES